MSIKSVMSEKAIASSTGLFHHAKIFNNIIFTSGQIGATPDGVLASTTIGPQAELTIKNLASILEVANSSLDRVLNVNIFLADPKDYAEFNEVYAKLMPDPKPPRTCVFVGLGEGVKCEMNMQAAVKE